LIPAKQPTPATGDDGSPTTLDGAALLVAGLALMGVTRYPARHARR